MNYRFLSLLRVIKKHGSFSYPFISYALENLHFSRAEIAWLKSIKYEGMYLYRLAMDEVKNGLSACSDNNLKFLLLSKKLELLRFLGRNKMADRLYARMKKDLSFLSPTVRDIIEVEFTAHRSFFHEEKDCLGKISKENKNFNDSAKAFLEINIGRNLIRNEKKEGLKHFRKAFELARTIPHPSGMATSANALAWYGKKYNMDEATRYTKEALYWLGWYFENPRLYVFDTALEVLNEANDVSFYEVAKDFIFLYESSPKEEKKKYKKRYAQAKRILSTTFYKSDGKMRIFLRKLNKQKYLERANISKMEIYNLLHSKVKNIRGETIRKIITKNPELFKEIELSKLPEGLICEMAKKKEELQDGIDAVINERQTLDPFIQARKDLAKAYLERISKRIRDEFVQKYITMDEGEKKIIDRFVRDYVRYDIRWGMRVNVPNEMKDLIQSFHFKKIPASLSYWTLDDEEKREKLVNVLKRFK
ncbi:hypothetical protein [Mesoaciditoga lauensis]|uniref:hypothetical protein n=1 Tax=Mesoaciditoga lauensis TaxID=1495039 RepID=UPI000567CAD6|nr:hypothetical protein [Mesoaciditoga lauensis]